MALSDYLTDAEWDACYYAFLGQHAVENYGVSMRMTIDALLNHGYQFQGLDEEGNKKQQVPSGNAQKLCMVMLGSPTPTKYAIMEIFDSGRRFLKEHLPSLVDETDAEWVEMMAAQEEVS